MQVALIHENSLQLGPIGYNYRMINSELEDLGLEETVGMISYENMPIHFGDSLTHLVPVETIIPDHDPKYHNLGNFTWEIIRENNLPIANRPVKLKVIYPIVDKSLEEVKYTIKSALKPIRKQKENSIVSLMIGDNEIQVSTSREERLLLSSKLAAAPQSHNYKFENTWLEITSEQLQYIISEVDRVVQGAYDWELQKLQEIETCSTIDEVYNIDLMN